MVKYLSDHDAYQSFLVGGHLASRSNKGDAKSRTDDARDSVGGNEAHTTCEYCSSFSTGTAQRLTSGQQSRKCETKPRIAAVVGKVSAHQEIKFEYC